MLNLKFAWIPDPGADSRQTAVNGIGSFLSQWEAFSVSTIQEGDIQIKPCYLVYLFIYGWNFHVCILNKNCLIVVCFYSPFLHTVTKIE